MRARMKELFILSRYKFRLLKKRCLSREAKQAQSIPPTLPSPNPLKGRLGLLSMEETKEVTWRQARDSGKRKRKYAKQERQKHSEKQKEAESETKRLKREEKEKGGRWMWQRREKGERGNKKLRKGGKKDKQQNQTDRRCLTITFSRILVYQLEFPAPGHLLIAILLSARGQKSRGHTMFFQPSRIQMFPVPGPGCTDGSKGLLFKKALNMHDS